MNRLLECSCDGKFISKIIEIALQGTAVLMVEQNAKQALEISNLGLCQIKVESLY